MFWWLIFQFPRSPVSCPYLGRYWCPAPDTNRDSNVSSVKTDLGYKRSFLSITGAKIRKNPVSTKFRHAIRSDFQQTYDLKVSYKRLALCLVGASLCFCGIEIMFWDINQHITKVIPDYMETCSVFSIQFFSLLLPLSV